MLTEKDRLGDRMGNEEDGGPGFLPEAQQLFVQLVARDLVERAEGLIHQQDAGPGHQRAGDRHALALAARQFVRHRLFTPLQSDESQKFFRIRVGRARFALSDQQRETHIVDHVAPRQQRCFLENEGEIAALARLARRLAMHGHGAIGDVHEIRDRSQQGGLAAAGRAEHGHERAGRYLDRDVGECGEAGIICAEADMKVLHRHGGATDCCLVGSATRFQHRLTLRSCGHRPSHPRLPWCRRRLHSGQGR
ncbi:hypothetical protein D9M68_538550 [compost metagenome]